jgi:hypothetical protein
MKDYLFPILNIIFSTILIYGPQMYIVTNNIMYMYLTIITTNLLIYVIYKMIQEKYNVVVTAMCGKIIPTIILSLLSFFVLKTQKITTIKAFALLIVIIGTYILVK